MYFKCNNEHQYFMAYETAILKHLHRRLWTPCFRLDKRSCILFFIFIVLICRTNRENGLLCVLQPLLNIQKQFSLLWCGTSCKGAAIQNTAVEVRVHGTVPAAGELPGNKTLALGLLPHRNGLLIVMFLCGMLLSVISLNLSLSKRIGLILYIWGQLALLYTNSSYKSVSYLRLTT